MCEDRPYASARECTFSADKVSFIECFIVFHGFGEISQRQAIVYRPEVGLTKYLYIYSTKYKVASSPSDLFKK